MNPQPSVVGALAPFLIAVLAVVFLAAAIWIGGAIVTAEPEPFPTAEETRHAD